MLIVVAVVMLVEIQPWVISKYRIWSTSPEVRANVWELLASLVSVSALASGAKIVSGLGGVTRGVAIVIVCLVGFFLPYLVAVKTASGLIYASSDSVWNVPFSDALTQLAKQLSLNPTWFVATCTILVGGALFSRFFVDVNITSMHGFYRDRLAAAYLVRHKKDGTAGAERDVNLYEICRDESVAPYHLINVTPTLLARKLHWKYTVGVLRESACESVWVVCMPGHNEARSSWRDGVEKNDQFSGYDITIVECNPR